jgi:transcription antitermination factor NusA-like protein
MRSHLDPLDPNQSTLRPSIQRISELSTSLNPLVDVSENTESLAEQVRWAIQLPERIRLLTRENRRAEAESEMDRLTTLLGKWDNVKGAQDLLHQCKAALAFGE